jgi:F-type H+-transporting ATPase subunit a
MARLHHFILAAVVIILMSGLLVQNLSAQDAHGTEGSQTSEHAMQHDADGHGADADHVEHAEEAGHDEHGGHHDVSKLKPGEEMFSILNHKVENTSYVHEWPFPTVEFPQDWVINVAGMPINLSLNRHVAYMLLSAFITALLMWVAARQNKKNKVPKGFGNMIESVVVFIRDEIAQPFLGHDAPRYIYLLLTFFFFILTMNLVGLLPFGATATGNINVTAGLAIISLSFMVGGGMRANGVMGYLKGLVPHGLPWPLYFILAPIEVLGVFTKPFALSVRLFANMVSGGLLIGAFYALIFGLDTVGIAPVSIAFLIFMTLLKIFVCFVQAYVFTILSSFFIGMYVHQDH